MDSPTEGKKSGGAQQNLIYISSETGVYSGGSGERVRGRTGAIGAKSKEQTGGFLFICEKVQTKRTVEKGGDEEVKGITEIPPFTPAKIINTQKVCLGKGKEGPDLQKEREKSVVKERPKILNDNRPSPRDPEL